MNRFRTLWTKVIHFCHWIQVFLGYKIWARPVYHRPKFQICPFHGCRMKRGRKTVTGAVYWCKKCQKGYHLEGGAVKLVPAKEK